MLAQLLSANAQVKPIVAQVGVAAAMMAIEACATNPACAAATIVLAKLACDALVDAHVLSKNYVADTLNLYKKQHSDSNSKLLYKPSDNNKQPNNQKDPNNNDNIIVKLLTAEKIVEKLRIHNFDLTQHEGGEHNGHSLERHGGKTIDGLIKRFEEEPALKQATSYPDIATANKITAEVIKQNAQNIADWYNNAKLYSKKEFEYDFKMEIGYGIKKENSEKIEKYTRVRIVLKKMDNKGEPKIVTSYPIEKMRVE